MALQIDEGALPSEECLYESVILWAKYGSLKKASLLLDDDDDDDDDDDKKEEGIDVEDDDLFDLEDRRGDLADVLQYIRFPMIDPAFLVNVVEKDPFVMDLPGVRDLVSAYFILSCSFVSHILFIAI